MRRSSPNKIGWGRQSKTAWMRNTVHSRINLSRQLQFWNARNTVYILIPGRQKAVRQFISTAIRLSEENQIDIKIVRNFECVTVSLMFEARPGMGYLKEVIRYADNINFFANVNGYEIIISLDCYTHAVYRHGIQLYP